MLRASNRTNQAPRRAAYMAAAVIGFSTSAVVWWLLIPSSSIQQEVAAVVRQRGLFNDAQPGQQDLALARLLSTEHLTSAIDDSRFADEGDTSLKGADAVEGIRARLRIDVAPRDKAGMQALTVRWTGARSASAARLVNVLARRLVDGGTRASAETPMVGAYPHGVEGQRGQLESAYAAAKQAASNAERAVNDARQQFEAALAAARTAEQENNVVSPAHVAARPGEPTPAPPLDAARNSWFLFHQQLADLENRRQELSERLMPEHPEMKALDEKIFTLRSQVAQQPPLPSPTTQPPAPVMGTAAPQRERDSYAAAQLEMRGQELTAAQAEFASAVGRERAAWQALRAVNNRSVIEMEPAKFTPPRTGHAATRTFITALCGALSGVFAALVWPVRRLTFSTVEEVRAVTQLPVIAISRHSLN